MLVSFFVWKQLKENCSKFTLHPVYNSAENRTMNLFICRGLLAFLLLNKLMIARLRRFVWAVEYVYL